MSETDLKIANSIREKLGTEVYNQLESTKHAKLVIPKRSLDNSIFDEKKGFVTLGSATFERSINDITDVKPFTQTLEIGKAIVDALEQGVHPSIRRLFYVVKPTGLFKDTKNKKGKQKGGQSESDAIIRDVEVLTGYTREEMGIITKAKGEIVGNIVMEAVRKVASKTARKVEDKVQMFDLSTLPFPMMIPSNADRITIKSVDAKFVLVIEKDTEFSEFYDAGLHQLLHCIMLTASGQPDRGTRTLVKRLSEEYGLPVVILTDMDPSGWRIASVYKYGSVSLSFDSEKLACTKAKYMGLLPSDLEKFNIPEDDLIDATDKDLTLAKMMLNNYPWILKDVPKEEIEMFLKRKKKAELESFTSHGYSYLQEKYIPERLKELGIV